MAEQIKKKTEVKTEIFKKYLLYNIYRHASAGLPLAAHKAKIQNHQAYGPSA